MPPSSIPVTLSDTAPWKQALRDAFRNPRELLDFLELDPTLLTAAQSASRDFAMLVPRHFAQRMRKGDINDPLLRQVLPIADEQLPQPGFIQDPLAEANSNPTPGIIHKYRGRALLVVSGGCAVNCRYCFRRHFPYEDNNPSRAQWQQSLDYLRRDTSIKEVIFSGGDPLAASDRLLQELTESIADIPHIHTLRIHSRLPIVIPERINANSLQWMQHPRLNTVMVVHSNHPNEIDPQVGKSLLSIKSSGITVLNQSVLLAGVNDSADTLASLSEKLFQYGALPYYLHLLDQVKGAAHFDVPESMACDLIAELQSRLPGYLVPRLVREQAGEPSKTPIPSVKPEPR